MLLWVCMMILQTSLKGWEGLRGFAMHVLLLRQSGEHRLGRGAWDGSGTKTGVYAPISWFEHI